MSARTGLLTIDPATIAAELFPDAREQALGLLRIVDTSDDPAVRKRAFAALGKLPQWGAEPTTTKPAGTTQLWEHVSAACEELDRYHVGDNSRYVSTGIATLDQKLGGGLRRSTLTLLGAPTGSGKSTILQLIASNAASAGGALLISPEMAAADLAEREIVRRSGCPRWHRSKWTRSDEIRDHAASEHARAASAMLDEQVPLLVVDNPAITMDGVLAIAEAAVRAVPTLRMVAIDYAQLIADVDDRKPRYLAVGAVAQRSVEMARKLDLAVVVASQVNEIDAQDKRSGPQRSRYTFRESKQLEHAAHRALIFDVEWEREAGGKRKVAKAQFDCIKNREGSMFRLDVDYRPEVFSVGDLSA